VCRKVSVYRIRPLEIREKPHRSLCVSWAAGNDIRSFLLFQSPQFECLAAGANGLVLFNRFYQPDIDLDELEIRPNVLLSGPQALVDLDWNSVWGVQASLAGSGGVHQSQDAIKLLTVGANVPMLCSALFRNGINYLRAVEQGILDWMERHEYESVEQTQGSMSQVRWPDPGVFERAQYMRAVKILQHVLARA